MVVRILYVKIILKYLYKVLVFNCFFFYKKYDIRFDWVYGYIWNYIIKIYKIVI